MKEWVGPPFRTFNLWSVPGKTGTGIWPRTFRFVNAPDNVDSRLLPTHRFVFGIWGDTAFRGRMPGASYRDLPTTISKSTILIAPHQQLPRPFRTNKPYSTTIGIHFPEIMRGRPASRM